ncbi:DUF885 domain-containing protein [Horticoccus luteus]|uniref:DUF885 domain-containing protein n=1 Tax=Horticoccus luteus TaxID=2862869 RepID=A0A8F9XGQ3_9BACT|nr:DUF885 domain-containing protein [Horticoccus luteus]QYM79477.1 DUF885 domain-containing protein [Horticoccus luteus]
MNPFRYLPLAVAGALLTLTASARTDADAAFETTARSTLDAYLRLNPENSTQLGDHRFDGTLTDYSPAGRDAQLAAYRAGLAALAHIDPAQLTGPNRVDAQILQLNLEAQIFYLTELKPFAWDVLSYNTSLADSIYLLTAREFAPAADRLHSAAQRLAAIPRVVAQAKANLVNPPAVYTQTAIKQIAGAIGLVHDGLDPLLAEAPALKAELAPAQEKAIAALTDYKTWLEQDLLPRSHGDFRLGADHYRQALRYTLASDLTPEEILARAEAELQSVTDTLYATALPLYRQYFPAADAAAEKDHRHVIKAVLDHLAQQHPDNATVVAFGRRTLQEATDFVRAHELVTVPNTPIELIVTPEFRRGRGIAYCDSPGALEPNGRTFIAIEPTPSDWPPSRVDSFFREYNNYMMHDLIVHEAMPGHFLQLAHSNQFKAPTLVRSIFQSGTFIEGWAVYTERVMADTGFGGPETKMQQLKMRLRVICNAILDQKIHMAGMTKEQALDLMMRQGFQEEGEAVAKWLRAQLSYTQLATYFVGAIEHDDMRAAAEKKLGATFNLKAYHDRVLSVGSPAVKFVREEVGF